VRPAINVGTSVSRVGGSAQIPAMRKVAGTLRLDLAQFRELEAFATFGADLDRSSQAQLGRGYRVVEVLKQPQYRPVPVEDEVLALFAVTNGYLDDVAVEDVRRFEAEMLGFLHTRHGDIPDHIRTAGTLDGIEERLRQALDEFKARFTSAR
jgi:F-type H+-transporting ATPase subunit alpha